MLLRDLPSSAAFPCGVTSAHATAGGEAPAQAGCSRHDQRIARILMLAEALGTPGSVAHLDSCDVRELPVILEQLERRYRRRVERQQAPTRGILWRIRKGER
jgi:hypothetical protein